MYLQPTQLRYKPGEYVLIEGFDIPEEMIIALIRTVRGAGGIPLVEIKQNRIQRELLRNADEGGIKADWRITKATGLKKVQAYIGIRGSQNIAEMSDVPTEGMRAYEKYWLTPVHFDIRVSKTKWVVLRWPSPSMAQSAKMSTEAFEDFYFDVCTLDYSHMERAISPLKTLMEATDEVHIIGQSTDLKFSIKDIPVILAPVKEISRWRMLYRPCP